MKKIKQKLLLRSSGRKASSNDDCDLNANSTEVRESSGSSSRQGHAKEESGPWGLKELFPGRDPIVDIVAVHGLNGHRETTWTCNKNTGGDGLMWLRDFLPETIPRARVWTWGYDSRTHTRSHTDCISKKKLYDHGRELVFDLDGARRESNSHQRPIIFIAHSLGGIVVKNALLHSDRVREGNLEEQRSINLSTYGIIFMGTPHQGGQGVGMGKILLNVAKVQGDASDSLLKHLQEHSELLQQQMSEFSLISQNFETKFAYETKPTPVAGAIPIVIVPKWSAVVPGTPDAAEFGINADHRNMTKFSNADNEDFKKLSCTLGFMIQKSGPKVEANWAFEARMKQAALAAVLKSSNRVFMVPFKRDLKFVGRTDIIAELDQKLSTESRVALAGIGGIGKSQIAIEYCYRFREKHPDASVFWVHAGTINRFKQAYEEIANHLGLVRKDDPKADALKLVSDWFNKEDNGKWLMILDNADDQAVFESRSHITEASGQSKPLVQYLPRCQKSSIIITTRDNRVGNRLTFGEEPLMVSMFDGRMAKILLRSKLGQDIEWIEEDAGKLVEALEFLPLAVTQAAAFISENYITLKKYTATLQASDSGLTNLLNQDLIDLRRDFDASSSVIRTWQVSFDQIRVQKPRAAEMLSLLAVLDRHGIPQELLLGNNEEQIEIITALGTLQAFSLISSDKEGDTFEMHRLVQLSTLKWLEMQNEKIKWQEKALQLLSTRFPDGGVYETWKLCALYLPHVMMVIESLVLGPDHVNELGLLVDTARYLYAQGQFISASQITRQALELYEKSRGNEHMDTLQSMQLLGEILSDEGSYNEAEKLLRNAFTSSKKTAGVKHKLTFSCVRLLAEALMLQGKYEEAKKILEQNMKLGSDIFGEEHDETLITMEVSLARAYVQLCQYRKAEELQVKVLEKRKKVLGEEHPDTLESMNDIASTYFNLNRLEEAEELEVQVLKGHEKILGVEHPATLISMNNLASTYRLLNRLEEAEELEVQVLKGHEKILGVEHPATLISMNNLASTYRHLNRLEEAEELQVQVLKVREKVLGVEHPHTLASMNNLAMTYFDLNRLEEAEELQVQVLEGNEKVLGVEHPHTLTSMNNLALTYRDLNRLEEAEDLQVRVLEGREKVLGVEHPDTLSSMSNLSLIWKTQDQIGKGLSLMSDAVRLSETVLGADDPDFKDRQRWLNEWMEESSQNPEEETKEG